MKVEVFLGAINRYGDGSQGSFIKAFVVTNRRSLIVHENYNSILIRNDIALLELPEDAPIDNNFIATLSLPSGTDLTSGFVGVEATIAGFGNVFSLC